MAGWRFHTLLSPVRALGMSGDGVGASRGPDNLETCWTPVVRFLDAQVLIATAWVAAAQGVVSEVQRLDQPSPAPRNSADSPTGAAHRRACPARRRRLDDADMSEFELPSNLARRLALHELPGSALRGWVAKLPGDGRAAGAAMVAAARPPVPARRRDVVGGAGANGCRGPAGAEGRLASSGGPA